MGLARIVFLLVVSPVSSSGWCFSNHAVGRIGKPLPSKNLRIRARGGGTLATPHPATKTVDNNGVASDDEASFKERGLAASLFSAYFAVMGAKCALPSVLSLLTHKDTGLSFEGWESLPQRLMARQLTLSTIAVALGKLLLGPVIDHFGGIRSLIFSLTLLAVLLATIACCNTFTVFAACWIGVDFLFSSCWAACINAVHQVFPEKEWAQRVGMLAVAARTGNAAAFSIFASILHMVVTRYKSVSQPWRLVFGASSVIQILPILLLSYFGVMNGNEKASEDKTVIDSMPTMTASLSVLAREAKTPEFWLHFISRSALMVYGSFLLFVPTLMSQCYAASSAFSARCGSLYAMGCLSSVTLLSRKFDSLRRRGKISSIISLLGLATLSSLVQLAHMSGVIHLSTNLSAATMFLWGFSFAIPFYIPPSLYALSRGGVESSATIADIFDFGGFGMLALFNGYVASVAHADLASWIPIFKLLAGCSLTALVSQSLAVYSE
jgi:MFS family permease